MVKNVRYNSVMCCSTVRATPENITVTNWNTPARDLRPVCGHSTFSGPELQGSYSPPTKSQPNACGLAGNPFPCARLYSMYYYYYYYHRDDGYKLG